MRKLQKQRISKITRKILPFALAVGVAGLTLFPGCRTPNLNQFKNKQHMSDNMEKQEKKADLSTIKPHKIKEVQEEKKEEPKKIKEEEKKQEAIGIGGIGHIPVKLKKVNRIH